MLFNGSRLVKGVSFNNYKDAGSPGSTIRAYNAQMADEIILIDILASIQNRRPNSSLIKNFLIDLEVPITIGGGIKSIDDAHNCFDAGADKVALGSVLFENKTIIKEIAKKYGSQAIVACIDFIKKENKYLIYNWLTKEIIEEDVFTFIETLVEEGIGEIRILRVDLEGTRKGMDHNLWKQISKKFRLPVILEGGSSDLENIIEIASKGVDSIALGTMLVFSDNNIIQIKRHLKNNHFLVRL